VKKLGRLAAIARLQATLEKNITFLYSNNPAIINSRKTIHDSNFNKKLNYLQA